MSKVSIVSWDEKTNDVRVYPSVKEAARTLGFLRTSIIFHLDKSASPLNGLYFFRKEEVENTGFESALRRREDKLLRDKRHIVLYSGLEVYRRYPSMEKVAEAFGMTPYAVRKAVENGDKIGGYSVGIMDKKWGYGCEDSGY